MTHIQYVRYITLPKHLLLASFCHAVGCNRSHHFHLECNVALMAANMLHSKKCLGYKTDTLSRDNAGFAVNSFIYYNIEKVIQGASKETIISSR